MTEQTRWWGCIDKLEYQVELCGPEELEFTRVSVFSVNNANEKVYIGLWYLLIRLH